MKFDMFNAIRQANQHLDQPVVSVRSHEGLYYVRVEVLSGGKMLREQMAITREQMSNEDQQVVDMKYAAMLDNLLNHALELTKLSDV